MIEPILIIVSIILIIIGMLLFIQSISIARDCKRLREETKILNRLNLLPSEQLKELLSLASWEEIPYLVNDLDFSYEDAEKARLLIRKYGRR